MKANKNSNTWYRKPLGTYGRSTTVEVSQTKVVAVPLIGTSVNLSDEKDDNCIA